MRHRASRLVSSYRFRIAAGSALAIGLVGAVWLWTLYAPISAAVLDQQEAHLRSVAQAGALALPVTASDPQTFSEALIARTDLRVTIVGADGTVLADTDEDPGVMENHAGRPEVGDALAGEVGVDRRVSRTLATEHIYVAVPASLDGERVALRVSESAERVTAVAADWRRSGLVLLAVSLAIAIGLSAWLASRATASVSRLADSAHAMAAGDLGAPVPPEPGELGVLSAALSDLGRQMRERLDALDAEQRTLRTVLDGLADAVFLLHGGEVRFANRASDTLFRQPHGGWRGRAFADCALPACVASTVERALGGGPAAEECPPDPSGRVLRITVVPLEPLETAPRSLVVIADVTERARLDRVRRDFVANASHELKTPTSGIQLLAESAATAARDGDTQQALAFAEQIEGEATRLRRLVLDLLDLSRLEAATAEATATDVREVLEVALLSHRPTASGKSLTLELDDSAVAGADVFAAVDRTDLAVALDNLLDNAVTYTETGGVTVRLQATTDEVAISVQDTGIGVPTEDLPRVFERFYRVDRARSRDSGGTGLGLALVRHVAERSGGTVEAASEPGAGSTFTLRLPRITGS